MTMLPRPYQQPYPPIWVAATFNPDSFEWAGRNGYNLMMVPYVSSHHEVGKLVQLYRRAWRDAGHPPGQEKIQLSYHCYVAEDGERARREARPHFEHSLGKMIEAAQTWTSSPRSGQYPGYEDLADRVSGHNFDELVSDVKLFVGDPDEVAKQIHLIQRYYGDVEPSLQFNFGAMPLDQARRSLELFANEVMPRFGALEDDAASSKRPAGTMTP
jgi:alkanesulfonate monooxygenase SsuD/methylene tetrahydromethanopterin reductase-like flavin-dependent oxidoreductase (luciferase family)